MVLLLLAVTLVFFATDLLKAFKVSKQVGLQLIQRMNKTLGS